MAKETREDIFSEDHRLWRKGRVEEDQQQEEFHKSLSEFPNLFSLIRFLNDDENTKNLLKRQEAAIEDDDFVYDLEKVRCDNLIIFFLYVLGRKQDAVEYSKFVKDGMSNSIIFLTLQAMLHWYFARQYECSETMASLQKLREDKDYEYLRAVAESEKGHLLIVIGPKGFLGSMDLLQNSIDNCQSDAYVWKFDLALAIRRNFNTFAYSEHAQLSSSSLAQKAANLLSDVAQNCPKQRYKARARVELAKLVQCLNGFVSLCKKEETESIQRLCKNHNRRTLLKEALGMSANDHFVYRECGRQCLYDGHVEQAKRLLESSYKKRKNAMICQLRGKAMIRTYLDDPKILKVHSVHRGETETAGASYAEEGCSSQEPYCNSLDSSCSAPNTSEQTLPQDDPHEIARDVRPHTSDVPEKQKHHKEATLKLLLKINRQDIHYDEHDSCIQAAERFYLEGLKHGPRNHALLYDTGRLYEGMRKPSEALKYYERIIGDKQLASPLFVANAYMQSGLCYLELSEYSEKERFTRRAEDMFMASLVECRKAVAHLPQVSEKRATVWDSYPEILKILHQTESRSSKNKEAKVHELMGNYLEAIQVHKEAMDLADTEQGRTEALCGIIKNHLRTNNVKEAKFILDMFLTSDQRESILTDDDRTTQELRDVAVEVNRRTARQALESGNTADAHSAIQWALVLTKILPDPGAQQSLACAETVSRQDVADLLEKFDCCIFYDSNSTSVELEDQLKKQAAVLASIMRSSFGMRISVNDEGATLGHLSFESELRLADSAPLVILVVGRGSQLSPRMTYIADTVLRSNLQSRILPILVGEGQNDCLPKPFDCLQPYPRAVELLSVDGSHVKVPVSEACHLFDALLGAKSVPLNDTV